MLFKSIFIDIHKSNSIFNFVCTQCTYTFTPKCNLMYTIHLLTFLWGWRKPGNSELWKPEKCGQWPEFRIRLGKLKIPATPQCWSPNENSQTASFFFFQINICLFFKSGFKKLVYDKCVKCEIFSRSRVRCQTSGFVPRIFVWDLPETK